MISSDYEVVRASLKLKIKNSNNDTIWESSVSKIGDNWIEFNGSSYEVFKLNPETNRLEQYTEKYNVTEWIEETIEQIKELHNQLKTFKVGDGVHYSVGSDVYPGTVIEVKGSIVKVQDDTSIALHKDIHRENQEWAFAPNPNGSIREFRRKRDGYFRPKGSKRETLYHGRYKHYDIHF